MSLMRSLHVLRVPPRALRISNAKPAFTQLRHASAFENDPSVTDPGMNGGYINPPPGKRALRDPYADWWDKQERRNFGEPIHEDNDIYAIFSPEPYTHATPGKAAFHFLIFVAGLLGLTGVVYMYYPDRPSAPRTWKDGLEKELGGKGALTAKKPLVEDSL